jgi:hypothetical protein
MRPLSIRELSSSTVTRTKGNEAYRNLKDHLASTDRLWIDLRNHELISFSFLDQLISRLDDSQVLQKITFILASDSSYERLAQIAALRNATIYYQKDDYDSPKTIQFRDAVSRTG